jgi:hypothetical protein
LGNDPLPVTDIVFSKLFGDFAFRQIKTGRESARLVFICFWRISIQTLIRNTQVVRVFHIVLFQKVIKLLVDTSGF